MNLFSKNAIISNIKAIDIQTYFNKLSVDTPLESMKKYKNCLNGIFKMAVDNDYCAKNPCENIKLISSVENEEKANIYENVKLIWCQDMPERTKTD